MKKSVFALLALAGGIAARAQAPQIGFKAGLNIATISTKQGTVSNKLSGHGGIMVHAHVSPNFAIQPELLYSGQGTKQQYLGQNFDWNLNYLNVPIMLQYMVADGLRIEAGPQVGLLLSAKVKNGGGSTDIKNDLKQADFGVGIGFGYVSSMGLGAGARYNFGLTNINKNQDLPIKNQVGQISVFYLIGGKGTTRTRR
ncbi:PorT family protein [Flaviaesturariibacter flavus]|uniref:PorT family protein n=1 Tax=Flaviaesturariibacter flavus TaxID=2502780 RepID=A0A4R1BNE9_9BACT|nr:porin family protein [Flaviaesturariibacter flavus]TCJ18991.1 PorT family protein [Flaviaesturariibacter flavus]